MSIPKKIHYVWVGSKPLPEEDQKYIDGWKKLNPGYEIKRWTENDIDLEKYPLVKKAIDEKRWALAADIIRMYAIYTEGGFYFDTDVEVLKSLDDLNMMPLLAGNLISGSRRLLLALKNIRRGLAKYCAVTSLRTRAKKSRQIPS